MSDTVGRKGTATKVRHSPYTSKINPFDFSNYIVTFTIDKQPVIFSHETAVIVSDGDEIAVAGVRNKDGLLEAHAYHNLTENVCGGIDPGRTIFVGGCGAMLLAVIVVGIPFIPFFLIWPILRYRRGGRAWRALERTTKQRYPGYVEEKDEAKPYAG